jgi:ribosome assembly protein YihI (activator of Der GTPase)
LKPKSPRIVSAARVPLDADSLKQVAKASQAKVKVKKEKKALENEELRVLMENEEKIANELERAQAIAMSRENKLG